LLGKSKLTPAIVCTDNEPVLAAREFVEVPLALVLPANEGEANSEFRMQNAESTSHSAFGNLRSAFPLARNRVAVAAAYAGDEQAIRERWPQQADVLDLLEPFARIREALDEAQKTARAA
jgi:hypothetical protein